MAFYAALFFGAVISALWAVFFIARERQWRASCQCWTPTRDEFFDAIDGVTSVYRYNTTPTTSIQRVKLDGSVVMGPRRDVD